MTSRILLLASGDFGVHVNQLLTEAHGGCEDTDLDAVEHGVTGLTAVVVSMWRPDMRLCERVDAASRRDGWCWLPVVASHPYIRVGPWFDPAARPCLRCYQERSAQHDGQRASSAALARAYERDPECGPRGYLPHHARVAAALASVALQSVLTTDPDETPLGHVASFNVLTSRTWRSRVIACHGCERCRPAGRSGQPSVDGGPLATLVHEMTTSRSRPRLVEVAR